MSGSGGVSVTASARLRKDYMRLMKDPVPYVLAAPMPSNILEWHYIITGAPDTPYEGGTFHGKLVFPAEFPFKPPSIYMITPNGRFQVNTRLCLSISDFHPDTWNPAWTVGTIVTGVLSFMNETTNTLGSLQSTEAEKRAFARQSRHTNLRNKTFNELFSELAQSLREEIATEEKERAAKVSTRGTADKKEDEADTGETNDNSVTGRAGEGGTGIHSWTYNACVVVAAVAVAFVVRYVVLNADTL